MISLKFTVHLFNGLNETNSTTQKKKQIYGNKSVQSADDVVINGHDRFLLSYNANSLI